MTARTTEQMLVHLKSGDFQAAANLFITGQNQGLFPSDSSLTSKLAVEIGKNATDKLITAFSHYPCQFCTKGRTKCKNCGGWGKIRDDAMCEQCIGLGVARCDFCNGSGWMAIEDIPKGLHIMVLTTRIQTAINRIKLVLAKPTPKFLENEPLTSFKESAQTYIYLDRYMGVLENMVVELKKLNIADSQFNIKVEKIIKKCVETAIKSKERIRQSIKCMSDSEIFESKMAEKDSSARKLAEDKAGFYKSMADKSDRFIDVDNEHTFLEKAIVKYVSEMHQIPNNNHQHND
jgi:hypothetical protein